MSLRLRVKNIPKNLSITIFAKENCSKSSFGNTIIARKKQPIITYNTITIENNNCSNNTRRVIDVQSEVDILGSCGEKIIIK